MADKKYPVSITTPFGSSLWAHLIEPDKKFTELGDFKVNLKLTDEDAKDLIAQIQAAKETALVDFQAEAKADGKSAKAIARIKLSDIDPYEEDEDEDGIQIFKFKRKAAFIKDNGERLDFEVPLVDATGKTIPADKKPNIGNGSTVRIIADLVPYHMATSGVGISLRLSKVQIKTLVEYSQDGPGFDACEDGGYVPAGQDASFGAAPGGDTGFTA